MKVVGKSVSTARWQKEYNDRKLRSSGHGHWSMGNGLEDRFGENLTFGAWTTEVIGTRVEWVKV